MTNLIKIESFLNDQSYSDLIEYSANFNARLCIERRLRMPFLDPQTGVAQKHSNLFMKKTQRIPGLKEGQIYTYPSSRWRCKRNLTSFNSRPFYRFRSSVVATHNLLATVPNPMIATPPAIINSESDANDFQALIDAESNSAADTDSKDSQVVKDETMSKEWFYEDVETNEINSEQGDSDFDYNVNGYKRKKKPVVTKKPTRKPKDSNRSSSSSNRSNKNRKSSRSSKSAKSDQSNDKFTDAEPRGFAEINNMQGDLFDDKFCSYRSFQ